VHFERVFEKSHYRRLVCITIPHAGFREKRLIVYEADSFHRNARKHKAAFLFDMESGSLV